LRDQEPSDQPHVNLSESEGKQMFRVVIADFQAEPLDIERKILGDIATIEAFEARDEQELWGRIEDADAIMMYHFLSIRRSTIERLTKCKLIVRCGAGIDNVDWRAAAERGIPVANVPDYGTEDVADTAIGMALTLARGTHLLNSRCQRNVSPWSYTEAAPIPRLRGRTMGIIGVGRIGTAAALRAKALGLDVAYYDPYAPSGRDKSLGIRFVEELPDLLRQSHLLSIHCPLSDETHHLINDETIRLLPKGAILVNTARGAVVDVRCVVKAIERGDLAGAGIDVLEQEPPLANDPVIQAWRDPSHPAYDRLILTPHAAFYSDEGIMDMRSKGSENCRRALLGKRLINVVNGVS
jgi:C-terminal binding protein